MQSDKEFSQYTTATLPRVHSAKKALMENVIVEVVYKIKGQYVRQFNRRNVHRNRCKRQICLDSDFAYPFLYSGSTIRRNIRSALRSGRFF